MRRALVFWALLFVACAAMAQTEQPNYKTAIGRFKKYYNTNQPDSVFSMFSAEMKTGLPIEKLKDIVTQMHAQIGDLKVTTFTGYFSTAGMYKADYEKATLMINLSLNGLNQVDGLYFKEYKGDKVAEAKLTEVKTQADAASQTPINDPSLTESPITLSTLGGTLSGTLTMPKNASGKIPVVLIIPGSGPTDRDGNSNFGPHPNTYKLIAAALGKAGIASLRYDKRGVGQSKTTAKEIDTKFTDMVDDANEFASTLKEDSRFSKLIVLGHSEGSLAGMLMIASTQVTFNGFISAAGPADAADLILTEQLKRSAPPSVQTEFKRIVDSLRKGKTTDRVDPALYSIMRPGIQKYMMSWMVFEPQKVIKRLKLPILIVQGTTDMQVDVAQAEKLKKAKSEATLKIIDGMSHILKDGPPDREQNLETYNKPDLPLKPEFITAVVSFVNAVK
ncbi:alpha/beta fold hydrolase [Mucilaginibacter sp. AW1-3]